MNKNNPQYLEQNYTYRQLRKMYTAAAREARAAYKEVKSRYAGSAADIMYQGDFKSFTTISKGGMKKTQLAKELASVERYLTGNFSSVERYADYRERSIETFHKHGYDFVNEENFNNVQEFMKDMTDRGLKSIYGSDVLIDALGSLGNVYKDTDIVSALSRAKKRDLSEEQLKANVAYWQQNIEDVIAGKRSGKLRVYSKVPSGRSNI